MIRIRPSEIGDDTTLAPASEQNTEEHKRRIALIWIPATLSVGLLIATVYLGGRILTAHSHRKTTALAAPAATDRIKLVPPPPVSPLPVSSTPAPPPESQTSETQAESKAAIPIFVGPELPLAANGGEAVPLIEPRHGERYIQVGALNSAATRRFVQRLRNEKLEPHVAPGPTPELLRVLIGPFDDTDTLMEQKTRLQSQGIDTFVRKY
jgi:cell division septation protein DedD